MAFLGCSLAERVVGHWVQESLHEPAPIKLHLIVIEIRAKVKNLKQRPDQWTRDLLEEIYQRNVDWKALSLSFHDRGGCKCGHCKPGAVQCQVGAGCDFAVVHNPAPPPPLTKELDEDLEARRTRGNFS